MRPDHPRPGDRGAPAARWSAGRAGRGMSLIELPACDSAAADEGAGGADDARRDHGGRVGRRAGQDGQGHDLEHHEPPVRPGDQPADHQPDRRGATRGRCPSPTPTRSPSSPRSPPSRPRLHQPAGGRTPGPPRQTVVGTRSAYPTWCRPTGRAPSSRKRASRGLRVAVLGATTAANHGLVATDIGSQIAVGGPFQAVGILQPRAAGLPGPGRQGIVPIGARSTSSAATRSDDRRLRRPPANQMTAATAADHSAAARPARPRGHGHRRLQRLRPGPAARDRVLDRLRP